MVSSEDGLPFPGMGSPPAMPKVSASLQQQEPHRLVAGRALVQGNEQGDAQGSLSPWKGQQGRDVSQDLLAARYHLVLQSMVCVWAKLCHAKWGREEKAAAFSIADSVLRHLRRDRSHW